MEPSRARRSARDPAGGSNPLCMSPRRVRPAGIESPSFRGGKATAIMGGMELDLRGAGLAEGAAELELSVIMGGIVIRVPRTWRLEIDAHPLLGGVEDKHTFEPGQPSVGTLRIRASAILGGIEIKD